MGNTSTDRLQNVAPKSNVADLRDVFDATNAFDKDRRRDNAHSGVLHTCNIYSAIKRFSTVYNIFIQSITLFHGDTPDR